jgi:cobalt-zinc-cadmium efflux system membrane fusion protein
MSATAWVPLGDAGETIVAVPAAALQRIQEGWSVFLPREDGAFEVRAVGRGRDLSGEVEVLSGLEPGELVVVEGAFLLKAEREKSRGDAGHHDH